MMRVVICHALFAGYWAACWRELARQPGIELFVVAYQSDGKLANSPFDNAMMSGLACRLLSPQEREDAGVVRSVVIEQKPDVVIVPGWRLPAYMRLAFDPGLSHAKIVLTADTPITRSWRQYLARFRLRGLMRRASAIVTPGERGYQFWRLVGAPERIVHRALLGVDYDAMATLLPARLGLPEGWPRRFLYLGRYVDVKAIDVMVEGYRRYRSVVPNPWPLTTCGSGPLVTLLQDQPGIEDRGFIQPQQMGSVMTDSGVFVLPSRFDPWPLVIPEACAAGLPVISSSACGSSVELIRPYYNGLIVPTDDPQALADAMRWMHQNHSQLPEMGRRSQALAQPYSAQMWAKRWAEMLRSL